MLELVADEKALERIDRSDVEALTEAATRSTFYVDGLSDAEVAANRRVVAISADSVFAAARGAHQHLAAAFVANAFAGFVIATIHDDDNRELDWLMVHPDFHGTEVAAALMKAGVEWLGRERPMWLNVIAHNDRAIRFYRRHGFEIDAGARTGHVVPHAIMRRAATTS